jgi:DNA-binding NarL/FixJ family response regulator
MSKDLVRIGIVDDHTLVRNALKNWLSQIHSFEVKTDAASGKELFEKLQEDSELDVLILDLLMPGLNGVECLKHLREEYPHIRVVVISMSLEHDTINKMLDLGAYGYLSKGADISELSDAIKEASQGKVHRNKIMTEALYWGKDHILQNDSLSNESLFTEKQKKILQLLWDEKSTQEIADEVFLSVSAVDKIKQQLKEKTGVKSTVGLIKYAIENRIIVPVSQDPSFSPMAPRTKS